MDNVRLKIQIDFFYDVWMCSRHLELSSDTLLKAIGATFRNRQTAAPADEIEALTSGFSERHRLQWNAFVKKIGEQELKDELGSVVEGVRIFAMPLLRRVAAGKLRPS